MVDGLELVAQLDKGVWLGFDTHKKTSLATAFNDNGKEISNWEMPTTAAQLDRMARSLPKGSKIAMEASTIGKAVFHRLRNAGLEVHMASPRQLKAITTSDVKTDRRDSYHLGNLLRNDYFPECYVPTVEFDRIRDIVRFRIGLGKQAARIKNQIHAMVSKNLMDSELSEYSDMFGKAGLEKLISLPFSEHDRTLLKAYLQQLTMFIAQEEQATEELARIGKGRRDVELLMTIPGIDFYGAIGIIGEIGDVHRFAHKKKIYSYAGLVPKADDSGEHQSKHRSVKHGNTILKYLFCNAVQGSIRARKPNAVAKFYTKKAKQIGECKALVAAARKMSGVVYTILTTGMPYIEENPDLTKRKMARMNHMAKSPQTPVSDKDLQDLASLIGSKGDILNRLAPEAEEE
jgi:transposase